MPRRMPAVDTDDYLQGPIVLQQPIGSPIDPTQVAVSFAFMVGDAQPAIADWIVGFWETGTDTSGKTAYYAGISVGPSGTVTTLKKGFTYQVWMKRGNVEEPVDTLTIF